MRGILYGVGVGPGDPELMTLKAVRLIKENDIIAVPGAEVRETVAYKIAVQAQLSQLRMNVSMNITDYSLPHPLQTRTLKPLMMVPGR